MCLKRADDVHWDKKVEIDFKEWLKLPSPFNAVRVLNAVIMGVGLQSFEELNAEFPSWEIKVTWPSGDEVVVHSTDGEGIAMLYGHRSILDIGTKGKLEFFGKTKSEATIADSQKAARKSTRKTRGRGDKATVANTKNSWVQGGIDLSEQDSALQVTKDANGGVRVNVDQALIARIEREGLSEVVPVIINMRATDIQTLF